MNVIKLVFALSACLILEPAFAQADITANILTCGSDGIGLAELAVDEGGKTGGVIYITLSEDDEAKPEKFNIVSGLKDVKNGTSATLIASSEKSESFGGNMTDSVLIRVLNGQKKAVLAYKGSVYRLACTRSTN